MAAETDQILEELRALRSKLNVLDNKLIELRLRDEEHKRNVEKFWHTEWPQLVRQVNSNTIELQQSKTDIAVAKAKAESAQKTGASLGLVGGGGVAAIVEIIKTYLSNP